MADTKVVRERVQQELMASRRLQDVGSILLVLLDVIDAQSARITELEQRIIDNEAGPYTGVSE